MVGPALKREVVAHVCQRLEASEREACQTLGQARRSQRYRAKPKEDDARLTAAIRRIAARETRASYRGVRRHLVREGWDVNLKRVHRIWKKEGLRVPPKSRKKRRLGNTENGTQRLRAERINHVWSYDFVFDRTESGGRLKWLPVLDEFTRECLSLEVGRSMTSGDVIDTLDELVVRRGVPEFIRSDNGPEFVANAVKDWIAEKGSKPSSSNRDHPGRTATVRASTRGFATSSSMWRVFRACWKPSYWATSTGTNTTTAVRTPLWET
jgi:transposase InsO family protein